MTWDQSSTKCGSFLDLYVEVCRMLVYTKNIYCQINVVIFAGKWFSFKPKKDVGMALKEVIEL